MAAKKMKKPATKPKVISVKSRIDVTESTQVYYANVAEISNSDHEFGISFARVPTKPSRATFEEAIKSGQFIAESNVHVIIPLTLVNGLIRALETQKKSYETNSGNLLPKGDF